MKLLEINSVCGIRSTGRIASDIAMEMANRGHSAIVAFGRKPFLKEHNLISYYFGSSFSFYKQALVSRFANNEGFGCKKATRHLIKFIDSFKPDIIHLHNLHGYYINVELLFNYLSSKDIPVVWTLHDCWPFTGHCAYFDSIQCLKWVDGCCSCPLKKAYPKSLLFDTSSKLYRKKKKLFTSIKKMTIVTPSLWLKDFVVKSFLKAFDLRVIYNGINTDIFREKNGQYFDQFGFKNKKIVLGVAAVWDERKGLKDFIFLSKNLSSDFQVVLVGIDDKKKKSIPDSIFCIASTNSTDELADIYSSADVFVNPTYSDNYPTTNIEAISCGTPVITYNTGGSPESALFYGMIVEKGNRDQLLSAVKSFESISKKGSDSFNFSRKRMVEEYINLYSELLKK